MASAFDGAGLGMFGSESKYMSAKRGDKPSPLAFLAGSLLMPKKEKTVELPPFSIGTAPSDQSSGAVPPPADISAEPVLPNAPNAAIPDSSGESEDHPDTQRAMEDLGFTTPVVEPKPLTTVPLSAISPDLLKPRNPAQDQLAGEMAIAPPSQMNLPQYGKQGGGGGGSALSALSSLFTLFA